MGRFSEQDSIDPDDPELDYWPPRLSERAAKLGPLASQTARLSERAAKLGPLASKTVRLSERAAKLGPSASQGARSEPVKVVQLSRPASLAPKAINEPARRTRDSDWRAALLGVAGRFAAAAVAVAVVAALFVIMKPASRQSIASSIPSDTTGSTPQSNQADVKSKPVAELKALLASPPSEPATHEQSQQLLQRFLQWDEKADSTEASASSAQPQ
jgi:hypothetical protein